MPMPMPFPCGLSGGLGDLVRGERPHLAGIARLAQPSGARSTRSVRADLFESRLAVGRRSIETLCEGTGARRVTARNGTASLS